MTAGTQTSLPWYKTWKVLFAILFFPVTLGYLVWKSKWSLPIKLVVTGLIVIIFIGIVTSEDKENVNTAQTDQQSAATEVAAASIKPTFTDQQKQDDYKKFYIEFMKKAQVVLLIQGSLPKLAELSGSKEELYLALGQISKMQDSVANIENQVVVPDSLKDEKDLQSAAFNLRLASRHFSNAIDEFNKYVNKGDLESLKKSKDKQQLGEEMLTQALNQAQATGTKLGVDYKSIVINEQ